MNERWMKTYLAAIGGACCDESIEDAHHAVKWAASVADVSEAYLTKRDEQERVEAAAEKKRKLDEATKKVMETRFYKVELSKRGIVELEVDRIAGDLAWFKSNQWNFTNGNVFDLAAGDEGWTPAPR